MTNGSPNAIAPETGDWEGAGERATFDPSLNVDVAGFEGPLDLLLELARRQKVDLARISMVALADQYLAFIENVRRLRIEIAADYLVMAAWLAYLKSRLLLPDERSGDDEPTGEELRAILAFRLKRLEAMREAGGRLINRNRLGRDFFARGMPEPVSVETRSQWSATLYDLLSAYASSRQRGAPPIVTIARRQVWSLADARAILTRLIGANGEWTALDSWLLRFLPDSGLRATALASSFAATLELVREGTLAMRQECAYAPLFLRDAKAGGQPDNSGQKS